MPDDSTMTSRGTYLPYGRQSVEEDDVAAVLAVLRSDWLTTGPKVAEFEKALAAFTGTAHAVAVSNGTAALHAIMAALRVGPGDEVIVPAISFVASSNCVLYQGATPVFADVDPETLLVDPEDVARKIGPRTKAILAVDYAGQPCDYQRLRAIASAHRLFLVADACHALGAHDETGRPVGLLADLSAFSFHPVKPITTGEGGCVTTNNDEFAARIRSFRSHGIATDFREREKKGSWFYEMTEIGHNLRLCDLQCALGLSQLRKLAGWVRRRQAVAARYDEAFRDLAGVQPLAVRLGVSHGYHLYVIKLAGDRDEAFRALRARGIGVNVHYLPIYLHPFYRDKFGDRAGLCPQAETAFARLLSLPIFPAMSDEDVARVAHEVSAVASVAA